MPKLAPKKKFWKREHDFDSILVNIPGAKWSRKWIISYYKKQMNKMFAWLKDKYLVVLVAKGGQTKQLSKMQLGKHVFLRRNYPGSKHRYKITKKFGVDDPNSLEYHLMRKTVEFHLTLGPTTDILWIDVDFVKGRVTPKCNWLQLVKKKIPQIKRIVAELFPNAKITLWRSGGKRLHLGEMHFMIKLKSPTGTTSARKKLQKELSQIGEPFGIKRLRKPAKSYLRFDTSTLKPTGSIRAPYSLCITGGKKIPLSA